MRKSVMAMFLVFMTSLPALAVEALNPMAEEKKLVSGEFRSTIPADKFRTVLDAYKKQQEILAGKSKAVIIDVRSEEEYESGHIEGAINIDFGHAAGIPAAWPDQNKEIWVHCRMSHRSTYFTALLYRYGYKNVYMVEGGIAKWVGEGLPLVNRHLGEFKLSQASQYINQGE